jgi:Zn-dependent peptidase ImmA (M78 family)
MNGQTKAKMFLLRNFNGEFPVNIFEISKFEGIFIEEQELSGEIVSNVNNILHKITVSKNIPQNIKSFVLAYSVGFLLINKSSKDIKLKDISYTKDLSNNEIINFAFNVLMPDTIFKNYFKSVSSDFDLIAQEFGVSPYIAKKKAEILGIIKK